jgi:hypothetical protein
MEYIFCVALYLHSGIASLASQQGFDIGTSNVAVPETTG